MNVYFESKVVTCAWVQQYQENLIEINGVPLIIKGKGSATIRCSSEDDETILLIRNVPQEYARDCIKNMLINDYMDMTEISVKESTSDEQDIEYFKSKEVFYHLYDWKGVRIWE